MISGKIMNKRISYCTKLNKVSKYPNLFIDIYDYYDKRITY